MRVCEETREGGGGERRPSVPLALSHLWHRWRQQHVSVSSKTQSFSTDISSCATTTGTAPASSSKVGAVSAGGGKQGVSVGKSYCPQRVNGRGVIVLHTKRGKQLLDGFPCRAAQHEEGKTRQDERG